MIGSTGFFGIMLAKATLLLVAGGLAAKVAQRGGAATRHAILALTLAAALGLPLGMIATPAWGVRILPRSNAPSVVTNSVVAIDKAPPITERSKGVMSVASSTSASSALFDSGLELWAPTLWIVGALVVVLWMTIGRLSLHQVARKANALGDTSWETILTDEKSRAGVQASIRLLSSPSASTPLTWGIRFPVILLPDEASDWPDAHRAVVLRHEIAHIARGDSLTQLLAGLTCALYWFHPLVWVAARKLRVEQERACDDRVLSSGTPRAEYAAHLLEVARSARALGGQGMVSLAMARPSQLEGRVLAVLNHSPSSRTRVSPVVRTAGIAAAVAVFIALSAFRPMPRAMLRAAVTPTIIATQFVVPPSPVKDKWDAATIAQKSAAGATLDSTFESSVEVSPGGTLVLDLNTGASLVITGWDQPRVRVSGTLGGRGWRDTDVHLSRDRSGATLTTRFSGRTGDQSFSHHFQISVPRRFNLRLSSAGGGVSITGMDGDFSGNTGGGSLILERLSGHAELHTGGGQIRVRASNLSGTVTTGGGTVEIQNGNGNLMAHSGSGPVVYLDNDHNGAGYGAGRRPDRKTDDDDNSTTISGSSSNVTINEGTGEIRDTRTGRVVFRKSGGSIALTEAMQGADVRTAGGGITIGRTAGGVIATTGGGNVTIGRSNGDVRVTTGGGDIELGPVDGSAEAQTGKGDVTIRLTGAGSHTVDVRSGTGKVVLIVPANLSAVLDLETAYTNNFGRRTRIESDWPLSISETDYWDGENGTPRKYVRARQTIGRGGPVIRVRTVNGDVVVQRQ